MDSLLIDYTLLHGRRVQVSGEAGTLKAVGLSHGGHTWGYWVAYLTGPVTFYSVIAQGVDPSPVWHDVACHVDWQLCLSLVDDGSLQQYISF